MSGLFSGGNTVSIRESAGFVRRRFSSACEKGVKDVFREASFSVPVRESGTIAARMGKRQGRLPKTVLPEKWRRGNSPAGKTQTTGNAGKRRRPYINFLAATLVEPDEVWWHWEKDRSKDGDWRLRRPYLRAFEIEGKNEYAVSVFEWGKSGWSGATAFMAEPEKLEKRLKYFNNQRIGRLLYRK